jgi:hypothetical protein
MKRTIQILVLTIISFQVSGQVASKDLNGEWTINNQDSSYYLSDTIKLIQDINYQYEIKTCSLIVWKKDKRKFEIHSINTCSEPGRGRKYNEKETIKLSHKNGIQTIEIKRNGEAIDFFQVLNYSEESIDRYPYDIKILKLIRIKTACNRCS